MGAKKTPWWSILGERSRSAECTQRTCGTCPAGHSFSDSYLDSCTQRSRCPTCTLQSL